MVLIAPPRDEDVRALVRQPDGGGQADSGASSGDHRRLAFQLSHVGVSITLDTEPFGIDTAGALEYDP
jgi:hypothetical protein